MIDNSRKQKINAFLKRMEWICQSNNFNEEEFKRIVYNELHNIGINVPNKSIEYIFTHWINNNNRYNTKVFNSEKHKYFCQFINEKYDMQVIKEADPVKLYIPIDENHLYHSVNRIFDFCENNNIIHTSKVAKVIRNDNVVLRVKNKDDALKVINFVNSDPYILEGRLEVNPFCINAGGVGLAIDNYNSYNSEVSSLIAQYILFNKNNNLNYKTGYDDFVNFVERVPLKYQDERDRIYKSEIRNLIFKSLNSDDVNVIFNHYDMVSGNKKVNQKNNDFSDMSRIVDILGSVVNVTIENHNINFAKVALVEYLKTGRLEGFSRYANDNGVPDQSLNYRNLLTGYDYHMVANILKNYTNSNNINDIVNIYFSPYEEVSAPDVR